MPTAFTGRYLNPLFTHSIYEREGEHDMLEEYLGCPAKFRQDKFALIFNTYILDLPVITIKKELIPIFEDLINSIQEKHNNCLTSAIRRYVLHSISTGGLSLKVVAKRFNMSERNLQRKLDTEGTSYQNILNTLRGELSKKYLKEKIPFPEIAFLLGFETQSAFNKFFKKHFKCTPGQYK